MPESRVSRWTTTHPVHDAFEHRPGYQLLKCLSELVQRVKNRDVVSLHTQVVADLELKATIGGSDVPKGFPRLSPHAILRLCLPDVVVAAVTIVFAASPVLDTATRDFGDVPDEAPVFRTKGTSPVTTREPLVIRSRRSTSGSNHASCVQSRRKNTIESTK